MDINLEKIELVKDRTGVSYNEAKEALEAAEGGVVDAIVAIEDKINENVDVKESFKDSMTFKKIKEIVEKGNISQIKIKKNGVTYVNFPVTIGVVGVVLVPWFAVIGAVAALGTHCEVELIDDKGMVVDVNAKASDLYDKAMSSDAAATAKEYLEKGYELSKKGLEAAKIKGEELKDKLYDLKNYGTDPEEVEVIDLTEDEETEDANR